MDHCHWSGHGRWIGSTTEVPRTHDRHGVGENAKIAGHAGLRESEACSTGRSGCACCRRAAIRRDGRGDGANAGAIPDHDIQPDPRGGAVFAGGRAGSVIMNTGGAAEPPTSRPVLRIGLDGETASADTVAEAWLPPRTDLEDLTTGPAPAQVRDALRGMAMPTVFEPRLLVGVLSDGGVVHSDSSAYALKVTPPARSRASGSRNRPRATPPSRRPW